MSKSVIYKFTGLSSMYLATLFENFQEHEMELKRLVKNEECDKKKKNIALKPTYVKDVELEDVDLQK